MLCTTAFVAKDAIHSSWHLTLQRLINDLHVLVQHVLPLLPLHALGVRGASLLLCPPGCLPRTYPRD